MRDIVIRLMHECAELADVKLAANLTDETILLEVGLDSIGFATLVARLEQDFDLDPFTATSEIIYPKTFGEFVGLYEQAQASGQSPRQ